MPTAEIGDNTDQNKLQKYMSEVMTACWKIVLSNLRIHVGIFN